MVKNILAIYFESLDIGKESVYSIGIALYENKRIKLNKEIDIQLRKCNKESLIDLLKEITTLVHKETLVISPNASFDIGVIRYFCDKFEIEYPMFDYLCTWKLSKIIKKEDINQELEAGHCTPSEKALECIEQYRKILEDSSCKNVEELLGKYNIEKGKLLNNSYIPFGINKRKNQLYGKNIVFTGGLSKMRRVDAFKKVSNVGAIPSNSISKHTDILVIGNQGVKNNRGKSSKIISAQKLISQGIELRIINEDEFIDMLNSINILT